VAEWLGFLLGVAVSPILDGGLEILDALTQALA
jgi:hypothetical protein